MLRGAHAPFAQNKEPPSGIAAASTAKLAWLKHKIVSLAVFEIDCWYTCTSACLQGAVFLVFFCVYVYLSLRGPVPFGVATIFIAIAAALMTIRTDQTVGEKSVWLLFVVMLSVFEVHKVYDERIASERQQQEIRTREAEHFESLLQKMGGLASTSENALKTSTEAINLLTGGNSYLYFDCGEVFKGSSTLQCFPKLIGSYPLKVHAIIFGPNGLFFDHEYNTFYPNQEGTPIASPTLVIPSNWPGTAWLFHSFLTASNGNYEETILIKKVGENWLWAARFGRVVTDKVSKKRKLDGVRLWSAAGFPQELLKADWDKIK